MKNLTQTTQGYLYATLAFTFWGLAPLYFKALSHVLPSEVLVHRIIWSVVLLLGVVLISRQVGALKQLLRNRDKLKYLFLSALLVSTNWLVFIWAVSNNRLVEASLGYYINPLVMVALGILFFKEKPNTAQKGAIALALGAIVYESLMLGRLPTISLILAFSFGFYALVRKAINLPSMLGLSVETLLLFPFALAYFGYLVAQGEQQMTLSFTPTTLLLLLAGIVTVLPLLWFNAAATRISMMHIGFFQYIGPTLSFMLALFLFDEPFTSEKLVTFILIWLALGLFSFDAYRGRKR